MCQFRRGPVSIWLCKAVAVRSVADDIDLIRIELRDITNLARYLQQAIPGLEWP